MTPGPSSPRARRCSTPSRTRSLYLAWCLEGIAGIAATDGRWTHAAQLCAARETVLTRIGADLPPLHPARYGQLLDSIDQALGTDAVAAARPSSDDLLPLDTLVAMTRARRSDGDKSVADVGSAASTAFRVSERAEALRG